MSACSDCFLYVAAEERCRFEYKVGLLGCEHQIPKGSQAAKGLAQTDAVLKKQEQAEMASASQPGLSGPPQSPRRGEGTGEAEAIVAECVAELEGILLKLPEGTVIGKKFNGWGKAIKGSKDV